jgi:flagellar hook-length control protein FliK
MNIESAKSSTLATGTGSVDIQSPSTNTVGVSPGGFSGALDEKLSQLQNIKAVVGMPDQASSVTELQAVNGLTVVVGVTAGAVEMQTIAALMGNSLPPSYKIKDETSHEAALAAVTDTLKYITTGTTAGEKAAEAAKNLKDVIAMTVPVQQNIKGEDTAQIQAQVDVEVQKSIGDATLVPIQQNINGVIAANIPDGQLSKDVTAAVISDQMTLDQVSVKPEKKKIEVAEVIGSAEQSTASDGSGVVIPVAVMIVPVIPVIPVAQAPVATTHASADVAQVDGSLSYIKTSTGEVALHQPVKITGDVPQAAAVFGQPVQGKQDFNLKYFENTVAGEKSAKIEQQILVAESEKTLPRVGVDVSQLNKSFPDIKADVPAITKPLNHPEWSKDLGERIVWMSSKAIPTAEIRLNPQHLGPISVRVNVVEDQATVVFTAHHAATREAIDASIPRLREMMGAQQLNLVEVSVFQNPASDQGRSQAQNFSHTAGGGAQVPVTVDGADDIEQEIDSGRALVSKGLLSIYA